jgi:hypothetical protein
MILWGGGSAGTNTGYLYDPVTDSWMLTSTVNTPAGRRNHSAVWTGSEMIVWGGNQGSYTAYLSSGGKYDPIADTWTAMTEVGAPIPGSSRKMVLAGQELIVFGGLNPGARYSPESDTWTPISEIGAPFVIRHSMVWTGEKVIVWGLGHFANVVSGALYNPESDTWASISLDQVPLPRIEHSTVWTGREMIVFGGRMPNSDIAYSDGARYDPQEDTWTAISLNQAPMARHQHTAVWTGNAMIVWGGEVNLQALNSGGRYLIDRDLDHDGDGFSASGGDCNDDDASRYPGAAELCNGFDDDCDGHADEDFADEDGDGVADCRDNCIGVPNADQEDYDLDGIGDGCESGAILADADLSGDVDGWDLVRLARGFGWTCYMANTFYFPATVDYDRNCVIDGDDLAILATYFGAATSPP